MNTRASQVLARKKGLEIVSDQHFGYLHAV